MEEKKLPIQTFTLILLSVSGINLDQWDSPQKHCIKPAFPLMKPYLIILLLLIAMDTSAQLTPYELSGKKETATYYEAIKHYEQLDKAYEQAKLFTYGNTDFGKRLHETDDETWLKMLDINLTGLFRITRAAVPEIFLRRRK